MHFSVQLYYQLLSRTIEVRDEMLYAVLPAEFTSVQLTVLQQIPECGLCTCTVIAEDAAMSIQWEDIMCSVLAHGGQIKWLLLHVLLFVDMTWWILLARCADHPASAEPRPPPPD